MQQRSKLRPNRALAVALAFASLLLLVLASGCTTGDQSSVALEGPGMPSDASADGACGAGTKDCGTGCIDLQNDGAHCGACGKACAAGQACQKGQCALSCQATLTECNGVCVHLPSDREFGQIRRWRRDHPNWVRISRAFFGGDAPRSAPDRLKGDPWAEFPVRQRKLRELRQRLPRGGHLLGRILRSHLPGGAHQLQRRVH